MVTSIADYLSEKRLLIFDFDGTIADTSPLHAEAFTKALSSMGVEVSYSEIAGLKTEDAIRYCLSATGISATDEMIYKLVVEKQAMARVLISQGLNSLPGVDSFLCWARSRFQLSIATSGSRAGVSLALEKLGFTDWFDPIVCADDVIHGKPSPDVYLQVLALSKVSAQNSLAFEDSQKGIDAASAAGISVIDVRELPFASFGLHMDSCK